MYVCMSACIAPRMSMHVHMVADPYVYTSTRLHACAYLTPATAKHPAEHGHSLGATKSPCSNHLALYFGSNRAISWLLGVIYVCVCVCMYICMCVCMYVCMYVCKHVCMCVRTCVCTDVCVCACNYVCMHVCMYVHCAEREGLVMPTLRCVLPPGRYSSMPQVCITCKDVRYLFVCLSACQMAQIC